MLQMLNLATIDNILLILKYFTDHSNGPFIEICRLLTNICLNKNNTCKLPLVYHNICIEKSGHFTFYLTSKYDILSILELSVGTNSYTLNNFSMYFNVLAYLNLPTFDNYD